MTAFRVILLVVMGLTAFGVMSDDQAKRTLLCLFTISGVFLLISFAVAAP